MDLTLQDIGDISQAVMAVFTFGTLGAAVFSVWFSIKTLNETREDRRERQKPHVAIPMGVDKIKLYPDTCEHCKGSHPVLNQHAFARMVNYGHGPALDVKVLWKATAVIIHGQSYPIDVTDVTSAYAESSNVFPVRPSNLLHGDKAMIGKLPYFVHQDKTRSIGQVVGEVTISYLDSRREKHTTQQKFRITTRYAEPEPSVLIAFHDENTSTDTMHDQHCTDCMDVGEYREEGESSESGSDKDLVSGMRAIRLIGNMINTKRGAESVSSASDRETKDGL